VRHIASGARWTDVIGLDLVVFLAFEQRQLGGRLDAFGSNGHGIDFYKRLVVMPQIILELPD
jgi:hypothetical protein